MNSLRFALGLAGLFVAASASAQTVINSVPYVINASGKYVLGNNLITASASQVAITINAPNVILDLNEFFVSGPGNTPSSTQDVIRVAGVANVTIRNGTVANNGFGISFAASAGSINHLIEKVRITRCYVSGIVFNSASSGSLIQNNVITEIGGNTAGSLQNGIITGGSVRIENNIVRMSATSGTSTGINCDVSDTDFVLRNTVSFAAAGIRNGVCQGNLTSGCTTPFVSIVDGGGNL